jgi:hypothetical protein
MQREIEQRFERVARRRPNPTYAPTEEYYDDPYSNTGYEEDYQQSYYTPRSQRVAQRAAPQQYYGDEDQEEMVGGNFLSSAYRGAKKALTAAHSTIKKHHFASRGLEYLGHPGYAKIAREVGYGYGDMDGEGLIGGDVEYATSATQRRYAKQYRKANPRQSKTGRKYKGDSNWHDYVAQEYKAERKYAFDILEAGRQVYDGKDVNTLTLLNIGRLYNGEPQITSASQYATYLRNRKPKPKARKSKKTTRRR